MMAMGNLKEERDRFVAFSFAAADLLVEVGADGVIRYAYGASRALTGQEASALVGLPCEVLFADHDRQMVRRVLQRLEQGGRLAPLAVALAPVRGKSRKMVLGGCHLPGGDAGRYYLTLSEGQALAPAEAVSAGRDRETGLLDSGAFEQRAAEVLRDERNQELGLTLLKLANFDRFTATAGADAASAFLTELGALLRAAAVDGRAAGRLAADRYGLIHGADFDGTALGAQIQEIAVATAPEAEAPVCERNEVALRTDGLSEEEAVKALVYAIASFASGADRPYSIESLAGGFQDLVKSTISKFKAYRDVVAQNRFTLAFQPVVELGSHTIRHHEVLTRLDGDRSPYQMVTFAEGLGVIEQFDLVVCRRAAESLTGARLSPSVRLALNLSAQSLESGLFLNTLLDLLDGVNMEERLLFEITESTQIRDLAAANEAIQRLRSRGYDVGLDDFGAGSASFPYLQALTVDFVKIDGGYVRGLLSDRRNAMILKAMCGLCRDMGVYTVAEMVETREQMDRLREVGVDCGQGYLFGRPGPRPVPAVAVAKDDDPTPVGPSSPIKPRSRGGYSTWN
jgi:EAL domain-containing protein (putative c-di-GMP-specific phosphodiesterase class I)/GGDEF domain-containing protein